MSEPTTKTEQIVNEPKSRVFAPRNDSLPTTGPMNFGGSSFMLFRVERGTCISEALDLGADLADGVSQLCGRLHDCINNGEIAYCAEIRALGFLGDAIGALNRSARIALERSIERPVEPRQ